MRLLSSLRSFLHKIIEGEFEVGRGYTGSGYLAYGGTLFEYNEDTGRFEFADFPVEWTWISTTKRVGKAKVAVPVGTILKHILFRKKGNIVKYYLATEEGFKEVDYEEEKKIWEKVGEHEIIAKCNRLEELGVEDCWLFYVRGVLSNYFRPTTDEGEAHMIAEMLKKAEGVLHEVKEKVKDLTGHEPLKLTFLPRDTLCAKLPYLGREEFKKLAQKYPYNSWLSCFEIPVKEVGQVAEELKRILSKRYYLLYSQKTEK